MIAVGEVSMYIDFQGNEVMPFLHGALHIFVCIHSHAHLIILYNLTSGKLTIWGPSLSLSYKVYSNNTVQPDRGKRH